MERSTWLRPSVADGLMRALSRAANRSQLWMAVAGVGVLVGGRARRGAVRGMLSVAGTSALANGVLKPLLPRRRPPRNDEPWFVRRGLAIPRSSSLPSGHAASAAAFATGMALESPTAGAVVAPLAAAVAYSRVHTGVHWPSDVLVGIAVGSAVAVGTRRWWAVRDQEPATLGSAQQVVALPSGRSLVVLVNPGSGDGGDAVLDELAAALPAAHVVELDAEADFGDQISGHVDAFAPQALGVCGGDGTVVTVAEAALRHGLPLAVFPGGTLNHFAYDAGVDDVAATCAAVEAGEGVRVDLGCVVVDGTRLAPFVNTASLGGYPDSVRLRERWQPHIGKWPAAAAAMVRVLAAAEPLEVEIDGDPAAIWLLFVGNGRYFPADQVPMSRPDMHRGTLDVRYLRADRRWSRLRLLTAAMTGTLAGSPTYVQADASMVRVHVTGPEVALATDGEVVAEGREFTFHSEPSAITLYRRR